MFPVASYDFPSLLSLGDLLLPASEPETKPYTDRIVGGHNASIEEFPYQVSFIVNQSYFCGGFIVSESYIVTAGHCAQK